jgi:hypothetical protein
MTYVPAIGPLWLRALVVGAFFLSIGILGLVVAIRPWAVAANAVVVLLLASVFGAFGILLIAYGSWRGVREKRTGNPLNK